MPERKTADHARLLVPFCVFEESSDPIPHAYIPNWNERRKCGARIFLRFITDTKHLRSRSLQTARVTPLTENDEIHTQLEETAVLFVAAGFLGHDISGISDSASAAPSDQIPAGRIRPGAP